MRNNNYFRTGKLLSTTGLLAIIALALIILLWMQPADVRGLPQGVSILSTSTENASTRPADSHTAAGGSFTTIVLNVTSQTSKWKAYIGNVSGKITLDNSNNKTIYDWAITNVQGEVYVSRNNSISFTSLGCANEGNISLEESYLDINSTSDDSITNTFNQKIHKSFVIGGSGLIQNSTCYSIATYVDDQAEPADEDATFQEILLSNGVSLVYVALLNDDKPGFDSNTYDFQLIVPDDPGEASTTYYFYAELG